MQLRLHITAKDGGKYWLDFDSRTGADAYKAEVAASEHWGKQGEYSIVEEDVSAEYAAKEQAQLAKEAARAKVEELKKKPVLSNPEIQEAIAALLKLV